MDEMKIPIGRSGFADIRTNNYYYIDKSGFIRELLRTDGRQVTLITRSRRFGKTLAQSCEEAIAQIDDRMYGEQFRDDYSKILCYGVSFYKKRCLVRLKGMDEKSLRQ